MIGREPVKVCLGKMGGQLRWYVDSFSFQGKGGGTQFPLYRLNLDEHSVSSNNFQVAYVCAELLDGVDPLQGIFNLPCVVEESCQAIRKGFKKKTVNVPPEMAPHFTEADLHRLPTIDVGDIRVTQPVDDYQVQLLFGLDNVAWGPKEETIFADGSGQLIL